MRRATTGVPRRYVAQWSFPTSPPVPKPRSAIRAALAAAIALLAIGLVPASAQAKHGQPLLFDTGARLLVPQTRDATFAELQDLGVDGVRIAVSWRSVAPDPTGQERPSGNLSDPAAYDLSQVAAAVEGAKARGWKVVLTVSSPVPRWGTEGARDTLTNPRPSDFQHFMTALGRRLGPSVDWWAIWNEPNLFKFLLPQYLKGKPPPRSCTAACSCRASRAGCGGPAKGQDADGGDGAARQRP